MAYQNLNNLNHLNGLGTATNVQSFNPNSISGLTIWIDATKQVYSDAGTTPVTNGGKVQQWNDISGNGNNLTQSTLANRPTYNTGVQNNLPTITFDGVSDLMTASFTINQPTHIFAVFNQITWNSTSRIWDGALLNDMLLYQNNVTPQINVYSGGQGATMTALAVNTYGVIDTTYNNPNSSIRLNNGTKQTDGAILNEVGGGLTLASAGGGAQLWGNVAFAELLIYNTVLSDANASLVNRYLGRKWGITVS